MIRTPPRDGGTRGKEPDDTGELPGLHLNTEPSYKPQLTQSQPLNTSQFYEENLTQDPLSTEKRSIPHSTNHTQRMGNLVGKAKLKHTEEKSLTKGNKKAVVGLLDQIKMECQSHCQATQNTTPALDPSSAEAIKETIAMEVSGRREYVETLFRRDTVAQEVLRASPEPSPCAPTMLRAPAQMSPKSAWRHPSPPCSNCREKDGRIRVLEEKIRTLLVFNETLIRAHSDFTLTLNNINLSFLSTLSSSSSQGAPTNAHVRMDYYEGTKAMEIVPPRMPSPRPEHVVLSPQPHAPAVVAQATASPMLLLEALNGPLSPSHPRVPLQPQPVSPYRHSTQFMPPHPHTLIPSRPIKPPPLIPPSITPSTGPGSHLHSGPKTPSAPGTSTITKTGIRIIKGTIREGYGIGKGKGKGMKPRGSQCLLCGKFYTSCSVLKHFKTKHPNYQAGRFRDHPDYPRIYHFKTMFPRTTCPPELRLDRESLVGVAGVRWEFTHPSDRSFGDRSPSSPTSSQ